MKDLGWKLKRKTYLCNIKTINAKYGNDKHQTISLVYYQQHRRPRYGIIGKTDCRSKTILQQDGQASAKDEITPYVDSMKVGMKLPADLDIKALREEHINEKYS